MDQRFREEQAGFRSGRSCTEQILILRNIIEQSRKRQKDIYVNFVDFKKAFDSIHRDTLWKILQLLLLCLDVAFHVCAKFNADI